MIAPGARVADRFDLLRLELGGPLYRAYTALELGAAREVTLWIPHAGLLTTPEARARFVDAARATRSADGTHLLRVIDAGVDPFLGAQEAAAQAGVGAARGGVWVSVTPAAGQTLGERISRGRPAPDPVVAYLAQSLARAIDSAHAVGLVHGYLRAGDVVMAGEWPRLSGVGLWTSVDRHAALAALRADVHLLAPEVRAGEVPSRRADVYAMAVILAEVALGQAAESGAEAAVLRDRLRRERPRLEAALRPAFAALPSDRPASATQLAAELASMVPAPRSPNATGEVRIGGQMVTPVVGTPTTAFTGAPPPGVSLLPALRSSPGFGGSSDDGSIAAAILSAAEGDDIDEAAFDETSEFATMPLPMMTTPPPMPADGRAMSSSETMTYRGHTPPPRKTPPQPIPSSFARSSGAVPSLDDRAERVVARGTMPPAQQAPPVPPSGSSGVALPAVIVVSSADAGSPYEGLSIEAEPAEPAELQVRLASIDPEAAIATAEFDADAATAARVVAGHIVAIQSVPESIDPEATPEGGTALPLPAPEVTGIRPMPVLPPPSEPGIEDAVPVAPLIIASTSQVRRYPTAQIAAVADSFAERALDARRQQIKIVAVIVGMVAGMVAALWWWQHTSKAPPPVHKPVPAAPAAPRPKPVVPLGATVPAPRAPCPPPMILVEGKDRFCIDPDEATDADRMPRAGVSLEAAASACSAQGKRLCAGREWEAACRGANRASYPWGGRPSASNRYCNLGPGRAIQRVGSFERCVSASGARDMSGNVAEWVAEGQLRGGSALVEGDGRCSRPVKLTPDRPLDDAGFRCCADPAL